MTYNSLIENQELTQGDSSAIYFFGLPDNSVLGSDWSAKYNILSDFGTPPIIERKLPLNTGSDTGDTYTAGTKFIFQILPSESEVLKSGSTYIVTVQITNLSINYNKEIAQFKLKVLPQAIK